jgi:hypothetical protein
MVDFDVVTGTAPPLRLPRSEPVPVKEKASETAPKPERTRAPSTGERQG